MPSLIQVSLVLRPVKSKQFPFPDGCFLPKLDVCVTSHLDCLWIAIHKRGQRIPRFLRRLMEHCIHALVSRIDIAPVRQKHDGGSPLQELLADETSVRGVLQWMSRWVFFESQKCQVTFWQSKKLAAGPLLLLAESGFCVHCGWRAERILHTTCSRGDHGDAQRIPILPEETYGHSNGIKVIWVRG
jgi:hypothetical protein